ncbi:MAG TPA: mechanosensitive ion channel domain-containing protein [Pirellulales bacterium]|nr:mechanosensitive ion channel domain-containing protein [Pirellulales bacterium]
MDQYIRFVGPNRAVEILGVKLVGMNAENGKKLLFTLALIVALLVINRLLRLVSWAVLGKRRNGPVGFWISQAISLGTAVLVVVSMVSVWFDDPTRLATAAGLVTAGLAFALQKVVTAVAGYFVILRGKTFNVGDRIRMGGVRGDVIALGFMQTTIMEMGQPPPVQGDEPAMWVQSRQYTGRVVTVTNSKLFDEPVYNYTRDFPYLWEEMILPVPYTADRARAEQILLSAARRHTVDLDELTAEALSEMQRRYFMEQPEIRPRVYYRLTDNWIEMTIRFVVRDHGMREIKDAMSRDILTGLESAGISVASGTYDIIGLPPIRIEGLSLDNRRLANGTPAK